MINKVSIRNFKSLRNVRIDLERFTIFVGPNASGKSSILQGLDFICQLFHLGKVGNERNKILEQRSHGVDGSVELAVQASGLCYRYLNPLTSIQQPKPGLRHAKIGEARLVAPSLDSSDSKPWSPDPNVTSPLPLSVLLRLEDSKLTSPGPAPDPTQMAPDGTGLHAALANMALNVPDSWQELQADLRRIIPTIRRLRHTPTASNRHPALLFDTVGAESLPASMVSEGTLMVLGILTAFYRPDRPNLILLDDLDRGLHPRAQKELVSLLRGLLDKHTDIQLVATTHSPYLLDWMEPNEVRILYLQEDGTTVCGALSEHPKFKKWKDEMNPGEMWSLFCEKWLVEQEAA